jgi:two-component system chemotaxis response regulator CheB
MQNRDIIVIGTSVGGIETLKKLVKKLPPDLRASVFVVLHISRDSPGVLPAILEKAGPLPALRANDGEKFKTGHIYVAPPDHHLLIDGEGIMNVTRGPKENGFRPAVDPLFRSAALAFGPRVIGVILTGNLDDGSAGLWAVKSQGGVAVVQEPNDSIAPSMPLSALAYVEVDYRVPVKEIGPLLGRLSEEPVKKKGVGSMPKLMETEVKIAAEKDAVANGITEWGEPSVFSCPECHGVLRELKEGPNVRFRCHVGHGYSLESLLAELTEKNEAALWAAVRSVDETVLLLRRMASALAKDKHAAAAEYLMERARQSEECSKLVRQAFLTHERVTKNK